MNHLTQPNPKSTKHTALYVAVNKLIEQYNTQFGFIDHAREEKFHQSDEPKEVMSVSEFCDKYIPPPAPHWESDYAAIWSRFDRDDDYTENDMRQDILELIRGLIK